MSEPSNLLPPPPGQDHTGSPCLPQSSTSPFEQLPIELFDEVLAILLSSAPPSSASYYQQMLSLRLVSSVWAKVIDHELPHLWSATSSKMHPELIKVCLERSKRTPLTVVCGRGTSSPWGAEEKRYQDMIGPHSERWRYLNVEGTLKGSPLEAALRCLLGRPLPRLERLHVFVNAWVIPEAGESDEYPHMIHAPLLKEVVLFNCAIPEQSLVGLPGLRHLRVGTLHPGLFQNRRYNPPALSFSSLVSMLRSSPSLDSFSIRGYNTVVDSPSPFGTITMGRLRALRLDRIAGSFILGILERLEAPSLEQLEVEPSSGPTTIDDQEALLALVGARMAAIAAVTRTSPPVLRVNATAWMVKIQYGSSSFTGNRMGDASYAYPRLYRPLMASLAADAAEPGKNQPKVLEVLVDDCSMIRQTLALFNEFFGSHIHKLVFLWHKVITFSEMSEIVECLTAGYQADGTPSGYCLFPNVRSLELHVHRGIGRGPSHDSPGFANGVVEIAKIRAKGDGCPIEEITLPLGAMASRYLEELQEAVPFVMASTGFVEL